MALYKPSAFRLESDFSYFVLHMNPVYCLGFEYGDNFVLKSSFAAFCPQYSR